MLFKHIIWRISSNKVGRVLLDIDLLTDIIGCKFFIT